MHTKVKEVPTQQGFAWLSQSGFTQSAGHHTKN